MTDKSEHKNIHTALAAAQATMGKAMKDSTNPHFKSKYADLASVMDACMPALTANGIAVTQPIETGEFGHTVKTVLTHGSTDTSVECAIPLIIGKNDMQGFGSALTYARRYGLMAMAGIAPEDDDGNAASKAAPRTVTPDQFIALRDKAEEAGVSEKALCNAYKAQSLEQFPADLLDRAMKKLDVTIAEKAKEREADKPDLDGDEIPY